LRIFWSDEVLKQNVGESFFGVIEKALMSSKHFVLLWTTEAIQSRWVKLEYESFFSHYHLLTPQARRLIIFKGKTFHSAQVPLFLKNIQCTQSIDEIILIAGGTDIRALQNENKALKEQLSQRDFQINELQTKYMDIKHNNDDLQKENETLKDKLHQSDFNIKEIQTMNADIKQTNDCLQKSIIKKEDFAIIEKATKKEAWIMAPTLEHDLYFLKDDVIKNMKRGVKYNYIVPNTIEMRTTIKKLKKIWQFNGIITDIEKKECSVNFKLLPQACVINTVLVFDPYDSKSKAILMPPTNPLFPESEYPYAILITDYHGVNYYTGKLQELFYHDCRPAKVYNDDK